jgi:predicted ATPase
LSVFAGPFDLEAAAAVALPGRSAADAVVPIASLAEASMLTVEQSGEPHAYRMLETLREFGRLRLRSRHGSGAARRAHAAYFIGLAERAAAFLDQPAFAGWADRLWSDYDELRVALDWSLANAGAPEAARAAPALCELWYRRGDAREAAAWSSRILAGDVAAIPRRVSWRPRTLRPRSRRTWPWTWRPRRRTRTRRSSSLGRRTTQAAWSSASAARRMWRWRAAIRIR